MTRSRSMAFAARRSATYHDFLTAGHAACCIYRRTIARADIVSLSSRCRASRRRCRAPPCALVAGTGPGHPHPRSPCPTFDCSLASSSSASLSASASGVRPADIAGLAIAAIATLASCGSSCLRCQIPHVVHSLAISEQAHIRDTLAFLRLPQPRDRIAWTRVLRRVADWGYRTARILGELDGQFAARRNVADLNDRLLRHARRQSPVSGDSLRFRRALGC